MQQLGRAFFIILVFFLGAITAQAEEVIKSFDVKLVAEQNGDYQVTETITVSVEGRQIRRGIFRDLPRYQLYQGVKIPVRYDVKSIGRNSHKEDYAIEKDGNAFRVRIGDADHYLTHADHTYEITYKIKDEIRRDEYFDDIYWNATGNYWAFPIESARIDIIAPEGAKLIRSDAWTGRLGGTEDNVEFTQSGNQYSFVSTQRFEPREGLTVSLKFEKGTFGPVQEGTLRYIWWLKNGALILLSLSFLAIAGLYYRNWNKVGRDPVKGAVFPRYEPPEDYSAAAASFIYFRGVRSHKALIATLMALATKKWIHIETDKKKTIITPLERNIKGHTRTLAQDLGRLTEEESYLFGRLFHRNRKKAITLKKKVNTHFNSSYSSFKTRLRRDFGKDYYRLNIGYTLIGILLSIIGVALTITQISNLTPGLFWLILAGLIITNIVFMVLMPAPTEKGQKIRTEIEGFRLFMKTAEKQKLDAVEVGSDQPPPMSVERYEQLLPYAIALGVEKPWSKYFEKVMPVEAKEYQPVWGGSHGNYKNVSSLTNSVVSNISSGVSSAQPQSSGSSGGGGFSGGGGGGGGGGGW